MSHRNLTVRSALFLGAATAAALTLSPSYAADQVEQIVVTGTHIVSPNMQSASPVLEASAVDIQVQGVTKIEDLLNQLPQVFAGQSATVSNGATGTAEVDLRGLGCDRTLVLLDGRRLSYGSALDSCADLNQIPTQLIEKVDVLTGGASAIYGSDAVSGVVNFIMKKDFEGFQTEFQYGTYEHDNANSAPGNIRSVIAGRAATNPAQFKLPDDQVWEGQSVQVSAILGASSANGKGNVTGYFSYRHNDPILQAAYDYSGCTVGAQSGANWTCGGSGTSYPGRVTDFGGLSTKLAKLDKTDCYTGTTFTCSSNFGITGSSFKVFNNSTDQYNYGPLNYFQRPDERYSAGFIGHYQAAPFAEIYTQVSYTDYSTIAQIAPSGDFGNTSSVNCSNPLLSVQQKQLLCGGYMLSSTGSLVGPFSDRVLSSTDSSPFYVYRRNVEGGGRQSQLRNTSFRALLGAKGEISDGFTYDVTGSYAHVESKQVYQHDFSASRLTKSLNVVTDPSTGNPVCASVLDGSDTNCVPYNVFTVGGVTAAALNYLQIPLIETGGTTQISFGANFGLDLTKDGFISPWAKNGVQLAFGAEYRQDSLETITDTSFATGDGAGQGGPTIGLSGATHVAEGYVEAALPIVEDLPFAKSISADLSYRFSSYDRIDTNSYGAQLQWTINDDVKLRGSYERAVRAPNVIEQFKANGNNLDSSFTVDPCGAGGYATLAACKATPGAGSASWYGNDSLNSPAAQYNVYQGGNPGLKAEKADTFTVGFVVTPQAIPGLVASVDFFDIKLRNSIAALAASDILDACYKLGNASQCANIHRTALGLLWTGTGYIDDRNTNIGGERTSGVDFSTSYQFELGDLGLGLGNAGSASLNLQGTWLNKLTTNTGLGSENACAGQYGSSCGTPNPEWRHVFRSTWEAPWYDLSVTASWRFYGGVKQYAAKSTAIDYRWPSRSYFDLSAAAPVYTGTTLRVGVNNLFDNDPPLSSVVGTTGNGNTYPQVYDAMGRYLFVSLTADL